MKGVILGLGELGDRLALVDRHLLAVLATRLGPAGLSDLVALYKQEEARRKSGSPLPALLRKEVEDNRIALARKWAVDHGIDTNFAAVVMYAVIAESCREQIRCMHLGQGERAVNESVPGELERFYRQELLRLTQKVAPVYDERYGEPFFGTGQYLEFEREKIEQMVKALPHHAALVELGCATAPIVSRFGEAFRKAVAIDISPDMLAQAVAKHPGSRGNKLFIRADLEKGICLSSRSVSLAVANFGAGSEVDDIDNLLSELRRVLRADGKFVLSFYNSQSLLSAFDFLPWPAPVAARVDPARRALEVHFGGETFLLLARPYTVAQVKTKFEEYELVAEHVYTHPVIGSIVPQELLSVERFAGYHVSRETGEVMAEVSGKDNLRLKQMIAEMDLKLAHTNFHYGAYILATGRTR